MRTREIAPGSILQRLYLRERLRRLRGGTFLEIGSGNGYNGRTLLKSGLRGLGVDLNASACEKNRELNREAIDAGRYDVQHVDFFAHDFDRKFDVILSCMVIEHLSDEDVDAYFRRAMELLEPRGVIITVVPAQPRYWGIEDDIAGHKRRYTFADFPRIAQRFGLTLRANAGLTFPVSNLLLPLSNRIVQANEAHKRGLSDREQTILSGNREVTFKTDFPWYMGLLLNDVTMYPLHLAQKAFAKSNRAMVIYSELALAA